MSTTVKSTENPAPFSTLTDTPEVASVRRRVQKVLKEHVTPERLAEHDENETYDLELYEALAAEGLIQLEAEIGGRRASHQSQVAVLEELAQRPLALALSCSTWEWIYSIPLATPSSAKSTSRRCYQGKLVCLSR